MPQNCFKKYRADFCPVPFFFAQPEQLIEQKANIYNLGRQNQMWKTTFPLWNGSRQQQACQSTVHGKIPLQQSPDFLDKYIYFKYIQNIFQYIYFYFQTNIFISLHILIQDSEYYVQSISSLMSFLCLSHHSLALAQRTTE